MRSILLLAALAGAGYVVAASLDDVRLIEALKRRDVKAFHALMAQHVPIDVVLPDGATALTWAAFLDLREPADELVNAGANVNTVTEYGETPLTLAAANANVGLVRKLLAKGADAKAARWNGETALMIAAETGSTEAVKLLLDHGADVNASEQRKGQNALMWAAAESHPAVIDLLVGAGANVNTPSKAGATPLMIAASRNDAPSVERLLAAGSSANSALPDGTRVLSIAASADAGRAAVVLLDHDADPNIADKAGNMPLHVAAQSGSLDLVRKLLAKGAKVDPRTSKAAARGPLNGGAAAFFRVTGEQTPLLLAARGDHVEVMKALIEAGADPTVKAQDGTTLLLAAAASGHAEAARYAYQFDKNVTAKDDRGYTAMHECVGGGGQATQDDMTELVQYLADIGVPLDQPDSRGRTAIRIGDFIPYDKPIQRMADIIVSRGGTPSYLPKEYVKGKMKE